MLNSNRRLSPLCCICLSRQKSPSKQSPSKQYGFSMLELLVTILIFAIGFLGVASMQATALRMTHDAALMGQASLLANSFADQLRAQGALSGVSAWQQQVADRLPNGSGDVVQSNHIYTLSLEWLESQDSTQISKHRHYSLSVFL